MDYKKFRRSTSNKVIAGVCGGLGDLFEVDPIIFRIIFLLLASGLVISLVIQLKRHRIEDPKLDEEATRNFKDGLKGSGIVIGIIVIFFLFAFGLVALFK